MAKGRIIEIAYNNLNGGMPRVSNPAFDYETNQIIYLDENTQKVVPGAVQKEAKLFSFVLNMKRSLSEDRGIQWYSRFEVLSPEDEKKLPNETLKRRNKMYREFVTFLKRHPDVSWRDANGVEQNTNCRTNLFSIIDEEESAKQLINSADNLASASTIITEAFRNDPEEFIAMAYGYGKGALFATKTIDSICGEMLKDVSRNPEPFLSFYHSPERELISVLNKAIVSVDGADPDIMRDGDLFFSGGNVIANGFNELKAYYKNNPKQYAYLSEKYGKKMKADN